MPHLSESSRKSILLVIALVCALTADCRETAGNQSPEIRPQHREQNESYGARSEAARQG